jgi:hypothetical protein
MIKLYHTNYCSILRRVIREATKLYYKNVIQESETKPKTVWNIINSVSGKADKASHLPHSFKLNNRKVLIERTAEISMITS